MKFPLRHILLTTITLGLLAGCGSAPTLTQSTISKQTIQAQNLTDDIRLPFYGNTYCEAKKGTPAHRFFNLITESCNPSLDTTRKLQIRLEMMEVMDQTFAGILAVRKPAIFGADRYKLAIAEATAGRQCYSEFDKNRDQLRAADIHRDMLKHLVHIFAAIDPMMKTELMQIGFKPSLFGATVSYMIKPDASIMVMKSNNWTTLYPFKD